MDHVDVEISGSYPSISAADIEEVERALGISLPSDYQNFLLAHNGGRPKPDAFPITGDPADEHGLLHRFYGIQAGKYDDLRNIARVFRERVPANFLPVACDPGGNQICLSVAGQDSGTVYFWDHEEEVDEGETPGYDNVYFIADSFNALLNSLAELPAYE